MISKRAKYGLKAALYLAHHYEDGPVYTSQLSKDEYIPRKFLEFILLDLKRSGLLSSKMGKNGGYYLTKSPDKIFVGEIIRTLEGPMAPVKCVSKIAYEPCPDCKDERTCEIRRVMKQVRDAMAKVLDHTTLADATRKRMSLAI